MVSVHSAGAFDGDEEEPVPLISSCSNERDLITLTQ
ncbi:hypothetical protein TSAR_006394 [Trichomalopsis sarcophagae]|uniref:Uncharacterized protein n=1 Tax=Trichomalopsis sarcophagae TaxID=543379 RepID=A0A232EIZ5_9HYME|nr:hypothetical protein TSAR_006394 [Trichomalopsis sarcophagae]